MLQKIELNGHAECENSGPNMDGRLLPRIQADPI